MTLKEKNKLKKGKRGAEVIKYHFVLCMDILSRFIYAVDLGEKINKDTLKEAFDVLFEKQKMPKYMVLRSDPDPSFLKLKKYFASKNIFLQVKRGRTKMGLLDVTLKHLKTRMIRFLKVHPNTSFTKLLSAAVKSHNSTYTPLLKAAPADVNSNFYDPILRKRLYKDYPKLEPFQTWYLDQLQKQKKSLTKRKTIGVKNADDFRDHS